MAINSENSPDTTTDDTLDQRLSERLAGLRQRQQWSLDDLAQRTGISRATLSRLERGENSPSASLLNRLCAAYGLPMSRLLAELENAPVRPLPRSEQALWVDPETGFRRRMVSPPGAGFVGELIEGELPPGASVLYEQPSVQGLEHHLWLQSGGLTLTLQDQAHPLQPGDSLRYRLWGSSRFQSTGSEPAHYLIAICHVSS